MKKNLNLFFYIFNPARDAAESNGTTARQEKGQDDGKIEEKKSYVIYACTVYLQLSFCHLAEETPMT